MTIYDFLKPTYPSINKITEEEAVKHISNALGLEFKYNIFMCRWEADAGNGTILGVRYGYYWDGGRRFLGVDADNKRTKGGASAPVDGIEDAVAWFRKRLEEYRK